MNNILLPIALWAALGLVGFSVLGMVVSGLRSVWYGKIEPLTIGIVSVPGVLFFVLRGAFGSWAQAGIYTLVALFALLLMGMVGTGLRQAVQGAFQ